MGCVFSKNTDAELHNVTFDCESPNCQRSIYSEAKKLMQSEKVYFNRVENGKIYLASNSCMESNKKHFKEW